MCERSLHCEPTQFSGTTFALFMVHGNDKLHGNRISVMPSSRIPDQAVNTSVCLWDDLMSVFDIWFGFKPWTRDH